MIDPLHIISDELNRSGSELAFAEGVKIGGIQFKVILGVLDQH